MMARENAQHKGRRYLTEGRLTVTRVDGDDIRSLCKGQGEIHTQAHIGAGRWECSCPARGLCAHLVALQLVTVQRRSP